MDKDKFSDDLVAIVSSIDITDIKTADMGEFVKCLGDICTELLDEHAPLVVKQNLVKQNFNLPQNNQFILLYIYK